MDLRRLGATDLMISPIGLGTWAISGSGWGFAWGPQDDSDSIATIHRALDAGMNWIDTAPVYGLGHAEEVVGRAVAGLSSRPYIFTKCGLIWDDARNVSNCLTKDSIWRELELSLQRLGVDVIDVYQIHWPIPNEYLEEAIGALAELKTAGKIRHIGVSNFTQSDIYRARAVAEVSCAQSMYSLLNRSVEQDLAFLQAEEIGLLVYSTMMSGLLSGAMSHARIATLPDDDWRPKHPEFSEPRLSRNLELVQLLGEIGAHHGISAGEVAIAWTLRSRAVSGAVVGGRRAKQIDGVVGAANFRLDALAAAQIDEFLRGYEALSADTHAKAFRGEL